MTKKDFFITVVKLFGLYMLVTFGLMILPYIASMFLSYVDGTSVIVTMTILTFAGGVAGVFIFGARSFVHVLKLDKGFDDDHVEFGSLRGVGLIQVAVFIVGGLLLINSLSDAIVIILRILDMLSRHLEFPDELKYYLIGHVIQIGIAFLLMTNYDVVARWFARKGEPQP